MRFVVIAMALLIGLIGLGMSVCGGTFLLSSLAGHIDGAWEVLLPLGSLAVGALLLWVCVKMIGD
jgi:hypothetical protein